ncbi:hypothetical protein CPAL_05250 [Clostridium thermopalmarium DSM 5974]|uniref:Uncharacterized protein n=3 Tax=Clostridiaceae TaxID=31979 RepID=A0A151ALA8_9CLOT|nr:hypothetical protein CLCOL_19160 [Clostridium colicanis DSM 13634]PRR75694.1 hypothetical protein CPAL_05250 [Clostridium thermopalmarium DSM 5974]PVZ26619.1 hypothetical protein LX19_00696 [Clostridium thermopalmarium DSM 5974]
MYKFKKYFKSLNTRSGVGHKNMDIKLRQYIDSLDEDVLRLQVIDMYRIFPEVKKYYDLKINPDLEKKLLDQYKMLIKKKFFFHKGKVKVKYSDISKIIREFNDKATMPDNVVELMLYYIDLGIELANTYGMVEEEFYINIEATFVKALKHIFRYDLKDIFKDKVKNIVESISITQGDFKDSMSNILFSYY